MIDTARKEAIVAMPDTQYHIAKWLRLTDTGYRRLSPCLPVGLKGTPLYRSIADRTGAGVSKNTVGRILGREQPVQFSSLESLFRLFGLAIESADFEPFPKAKRSGPTQYRVPQELSEWFVGRTQELKALHTLLSEKNVVVISGLGGLGKTQTALAYCDLYKDRYKYVFWVRADSEADLQQGYAEIGSHLQLPGTALSEQERAAAAMRWFERHSGWLLVLDNMDEPHRETRDFPPASKGHVLITTRLERLDLGAAQAYFSLTTLSPQDSLDFLLSRCRRSGAGVAERGAAAELAEELGHLPLAMAQAAAYIARVTTFANYLALYRKRRLAQLEKTTPSAEALPVAVGTTWEINLQAIEEEAQQTQTAGRHAAALLRFGAFLAPDDIPFELIRLGTREVCPELNGLFENAEDDAEAEEIYNEVLEPLTRYSLAAKKLEDHTFSLHRLVQAVTRERLSDAERRDWKGHVVKAMDRAFPLPTFENRRLCERLLPHAVTVGEMILQEQVATAEAGRLLDHTGRFLFDHGHYARAESYYQSAMEIRRAALDAGHLDLAFGCTNLALLRHRQGLCDEAESLYGQALEITRRHFPEDHVEIAKIHNDLAGVYDSLHRADDAERSYRRSLDILQRILPDENPHSANVIHNLALLYYHQKHDDKAEQFYRQALEIWRKCLPRDHPQIATGAHNLAQLYRKQRRLEEARPLFLDALSIQKQVYPEGHPDLAITHCNLALLYEDLGCDREAKHHLIQTVEIDRKMFGEKHPEVVADQKRLDDFYERLLRRKLSPS